MGNSTQCVVDEGNFATAAGLLYRETRVDARAKCSKNPTSKNIVPEARGKPVRLIPTSNL